MLVRQPDDALGVFDRGNGGAERCARSEIERHGGRRKLREMIDEQRPRLHIHLGDGRERHLAAARRRHVNGGERIDGAVRRGVRLENDPILIRLRENGGDDSLAEGVVKRIVHRTHADPEARRAVAIDSDVGGEAIVLLVAHDIGELGLLAQHVQQLRRPRRQSRGVGAFQSELILGAAHRRVEGQILHRLHVESDAGDAGRFAAQAADHVGDFAVR